MRKLLVINAVALTEKLISDKTPNLKYYLDKSKSYLTPPIPAVTMSSQASIMSGKPVSEHGIVANGWYFRDLAQVWLWRQPDSLIQADNFWDKIKAADPSFKVAKMFWWFNMYSSADISVTPRPVYRADGVKIPDAYTQPASLNDELKERFGSFPLFKFWGPMTSVESTQWITDSSCYVMEKEQPNLTMVYLPHLDYNLQRLGPNHSDIEADMIELDGQIAQLRACAEKNDYDVVILSEYGIQEVSRPIHINRVLRKNDFIDIRIECGEEHFDAGASRAFAVADHQVAHVYVEKDEDIEAVANLLKKEPGIAEVLVGDERAKYAQDHERSGEIVCLAEKDAWFTYYYWLDDAKAPDYARSVDIHRKPGYDPVELFLVPGGKLKAAFTLLKKKLGMRYLMNVIPLDADLVKGSHGVHCASNAEGPLLIGDLNFAEGSVQPMENCAELFTNYFMAD